MQKNGSLLWKNELKGWGYSFVKMANAGNGVAIAGAAHAAASAEITAST